MHFYILIMIFNFIFFCNRQQLGRWLGNPKSSFDSTLNQNITFQKNVSISIKQNEHCISFILERNTLNYTIITFHLTLGYLN